jgi:hypothetical protein
MCSRLYMANAEWRFGVEKAIDLIMLYCLVSLDREVPHGHCMSLPQPLSFGFLPQSLVLGLVGTLPQRRVACDGSVCLRSRVRCSQTPRGVVCLYTRGVHAPHRPGGTLRGVPQEWARSFPSHTGLQGTAKAP